MQFLPVWLTARPCESTMPTCRDSHCLSSAASAFNTSAADFPSRSIVSPLGPKEGFTVACVAITPTPASAHGTSVPTLKYFDCTATPSSCVFGSKATIENVPRGASASAEQCKTTIREATASCILRAMKPPTTQESNQIST